MRYRQIFVGIKLTGLFFIIYFCFMFMGNNVQAKEQTLTGNIYWGTNPYNGYNIIGNKCCYDVNDGDILILDNVDAYGDMSSAANNGIKVNQGGTLIVRNTRFHDAHSIHIVMNGGTVHLYSGSSTPECYEFCAGKGTVYVHDGKWEANRHSYGGEGVFYMYPGSEVYIEGGRIGSISQPSATATSYVTQYGVYGYGATVYMSGGTIENCLIGIWARDVYMSGGTVRNCNKTALSNKGNSYSFAWAAGVVILYGNSEFTGGRVENNEYGILNMSNMILDGTVVKGNDYGVCHSDESCSQKSSIDQNTYAGVYVQYDNYHVYDGGVVNDSKSSDYNRAGIVLTDEYHIYVSEKQKSEDTRIGSIYVMPDHRYLGRKVVITDYDKSIDATEYAKEKTNLAFDGWEYRSGVGTNSAYGNLILSSDACVIYNKNFLLDGFEVRMKDENGIDIVMNSKQLIAKGYWKEPCQISEEMPVIIVDGNAISNMFFSHWNTSVNDDGTILNPGECVPGEYMEDTAVLYAFYEIMPDIYYRGNGQTAGEDYIKKYEIGQAYKLDESKFERTGYSHQGWGATNSLVYRDEGIYKPGDILDIKSATDWAVANGEFYVSDDGNIAINVYSVWDKVPEITTKDIVVLKGKDDEISFEKICENIVALDEEDGDLNAVTTSENYIGFIIGNYDCEEKLKQDVELLPDGGALLIVVKAMDGAKNVATDNFWIYVNSQMPANEQVACYVRSINREAYKTHENEFGGCLPKSKWYEKEQCVSSINLAFDSLESNAAEETYLLGHDTRLSAIEWILDRGFSKTKTDSAIKEWGRTLNKT